MPDINEIMTEIHKLVEKLQMNQNSELNIEIKADQPDYFWCFIENERLMGEIVVNKGGFQPFRNVSFTIVASENEEEEHPFYYCYYDDETSSMEEIKSNLHKGMRLF